MNCIAGKTRGFVMTVALTAMAGLGFSAFGASEALAQNAWKPTVLTVHDPDPNDLARTKVQNGVTRLRKTDEEFTNEQAVVKMLGNGTSGLYVEMRTGALSTGEKPQNKMQAACTPVELTQAADGTVAFVSKPGERFVTDNKGNEHRNANKPELLSINGGKNMLLMFNYQPNNGSDTIRYAKVLDAQCKEITVKDANGNTKKQIEIMHKNNDDCDMHQSGEGPGEVVTDANGTAHVVLWAGCNGNGTDDGWLNDINVACQNDAAGNATACTISKNFDISLCKREERSRGRCSVADADPNTAICTWTEGNNQPQRDGTWMAAVDISPNGPKGADAKARLLWKEQIDGKKNGPDGQKTYSVRANQARVLAPRADGTLEKTDQIMFFSADLSNRNNDDNRKGGTYRAFQFAVIKATRDGLTYVSPLTNTTDMLLGIDATHLSVAPALFGDGATSMPGFTLLQGSHNGGGVGQAEVKAIGWDRTANKWVDLGTHASGAQYDRHLYSNYLGNNPGNQGRNFAGATLLANPFLGQKGSTVKFFDAYALTGKDPKFVDNPALKPSSYIALMPISSLTAPAAPPADTPPPTPGHGTPGTGTGTGTGRGTGTGNGTGNGTATASPDAGPPAAAPTPDAPVGNPPSMLGCSVAVGGQAGAGSALVMLAGLAALYFVRRRRAS